MNHIKWRSPNCRCPKGLFSLDSSAGILRDATVSGWRFPVRTFVRGHPRECIQMRCFICFTQAAALFPCQSAFKLKFTWKGVCFCSPEEVQGDRGEDKDTGRPSRVLERGTEHTSLLPLPASFLLPLLPHGKEWPFSEASADSVGIAPLALSALRCSLTSHPEYEKLN